MRILVVTRSYPAAGDLYQYPFVHRRVLAYASAGHPVAVFRPVPGTGLSSHDFEGVTCFSGGSRALAQFVSGWRPDVIAAHGFSEQLWDALEPLAGSAPIAAWLHGSEIPGIFRAKAQCTADPAARSAAFEGLRQRCAFWESFLAGMPDRFRLVFVSNSAVALAREDWGEALADAHFAVIPNPIDTDLFVYRKKAAEARFQVLMIRPFDSPAYGNDLAVAAIRTLAGRPGFERFRFTIVGDGPLFDDTLKPLQAMSNVTIHRRFLTQSEIAGQHARNGIFLVPTRLDTQGVSRDEAMASGLVPVTNRVAAVPEFVDACCAGLAAPDDANGLADELGNMAADPALFLRRSAAAAARVRSQSGHERIIPAELALLAEVAGG